MPNEEQATTQGQQAATQQELVNKLAQKVREYGIDGGFVDIVCLTGVVFEASVVVAREVMTHLGLDNRTEPDRFDQWTLEVANYLVQRIQIVTQPQTMASPVARPGMALSPEALAEMAIAERQTRAERRRKR